MSYYSQTLSAAWLKPWLNPIGKSPLLPAYRSLSRQETRDKCVSRNPPSDFIQMIDLKLASAWFCTIIRAPECKKQHRVLILDVITSSGIQSPWGLKKKEKKKKEMEYISICKEYFWKRGGVRWRERRPHSTPHSHLGGVPHATQL